MTSKQLIFLLGLLLPLAVSAANWDSLTPAEQRLLKPFEETWNGMSEQRQERLRNAASRWKSMTPEQRQRLRDRAKDRPRPAPRR